MNVPRPLLVLVIVIIILGVVACGVGVIRGRQDAAGPTPTPAVQFEGFGDSAVPARDVTASPANRCTRSGRDITISTSCLLTIDPLSIRPRSLKLLVTSGSVDIVVRQEIRGEIRESDEETLAFGQQTKISVAGTSPTRVSLSCGSCQVQVQD